MAVGLSLALIFRFGTMQASTRWRWVTPGNIAASFLWLFSSIIFEWIVTTFGSFDRLYGSLSAAVGFMIWVWISVIAVLFGAEINAAVYRETNSGSSKTE